MATKRKKKQTKEWTIENDAFHPDAAIAARVANRDAAKAAIAKLGEEIPRQERRLDRAAGNVERNREKETLKNLKALLKENTDRLAEYDEEEKDTSESS